jgi:predicted RNA-binding Zn-ribbon protein involved in translation (DUF1610 family)
LKENIDLSEEAKSPAVTFHCVYCGSRLQVGAEHSGKVSECPHCLRRTPVPDATRSSNGTRAAYIYPPEIIALEIVFLCPQCGTRLRIDARDAGTTALCPPCNGKIRVPGIPLFVETESFRCEDRAPVVLSSARLTSQEIEFLSRADIFDTDPCHVAEGKA